MVHCRERVVIRGRVQFSITLAADSDLTTADIDLPRAVM
jgi:hypothetical protein